jgi:hypothetical protein
VGLLHPLGQTTRTWAKRVHMTAVIVRVVMRGSAAISGT